MVRIVRTIFLYVIVAIVFVASIYHNILRNSISDEFLRSSRVPLNPQPYNSHQNSYNQIIHEEHLSYNHITTAAGGKFSLSSVDRITTSIYTLSVLFPAWQVLVVVSPENSPLPSDDSGKFLCLYPNKTTSPANSYAILPSPDRATFTCELPARLRRRMPFPQPVLIESSGDNSPASVPLAPDMLRWDFLVYEALFTENDVVAFVKGVNKRQGQGKEPHEFNCVFGDDVANGVRTPVTSSVQEVFRCQRPDITDVSLSSPEKERIKVSLEFSANKQVIPSIAYDTPTRKVATQQPKNLLCACTMVYNIAKFLKEWVIYHSKIGVEKFILYDNVSDDNLKEVVEDLVKEGYDVNTKFWLWPKTQEAGFSHCAINANDSCTWMMFIDVDEFVYSPSWFNSSNPSKSMLKSLLPKPYRENSIGINNELELSNPAVGQIMIGCHEFGPSHQRSHPELGVVRGYNCRKRVENRVKSIVLLDAIQDSLANMIHHFSLKQGYKAKKLNIHTAVINHYKFQAWPEFKAKFRRRVSAYVVDWTQAVNPRSNDRTPGLGFSAVEPEGWPEKFCEVSDNELKDVAERWFAVETPLWYHQL